MDAKKCDVCKTFYEASADDPILCGWHVRAESERTVHWSIDICQSCGDILKFGTEYDCDAKKKLITVLQRYHKTMLAFFAVAVAEIGQ